MKEQQATLSSERTRNVIGSYQLLITLFWSYTILLGYHCLSLSVNLWGIAFFTCGCVVSIIIICFSKTWTSYVLLTMQIGIGLPHMVIHFEHTPLILFAHAAHVLYDMCRLSTMAFRDLQYDGLQVLGMGIAAIAGFMLLVFAYGEGNTYAYIDYAIIGGVTGTTLMFTFLFREAIISLRTESKFPEY